MKYPKCQCESPTSNCPLYGWMLAKKWEVCHGNGISDHERDVMMDFLISGRPSGGPSLLKKVNNLIVAIIKHAATGLARVSNETLKKRLDTCSTCNKLQTNGECSLCGCPVELKCTWKSEGCPENKWAAENGPGGCGCRG